MITLNFDDVLKRVYNAKKGVEVRYGLGQGFEYCKQFADEAQGYATSAKASEKKATDAVAGIEQTKTDAVQAVQNAQTTATTAVQQAQSTATTAVTTKQTEAVQAVGTAQTGAVKAVDDERDAALQQVANSTQAAQTAASNASTAANAAGNAATAAGGYASNAESSATAASGSAGAAATSESNAATSAQSAGTDADRAEAAAELAGTRANTDKTLKTENAPADAKAVGDIILDRTNDTPQPIFYSKAEVDKLLEDCKEAAKRAALLAANPVGKLWASDDPTSPASIVGGTWEQIAQDRALMGASDAHPAGTTASAGLPNISGTWGNIRVPSGVREGGSLPDSDLTGAFKKTEFKTNTIYTSVDGTDVYGWDKLIFSASESNPLYGASDTVQPPAYYAYIWRRIA
nr:MAG TPA: baseplate protein [Bacteriophage sp.]